ncbi:MmcQ/YjbR family DNA-binding protein [Megasphaera sp.]|uniref:MmcQ/YjbR family DNA-binding protein n=1 Tax=Megasphaera sp. TaxID=2023260 RepID=UPI004026BCB8
MKTWEDYKNHVKAISENSGFDIKEMEELVFARKRWIESQMLAYGFQKIRNTYILEKPLLDGDFKTTISVTSKGAVTGNVIDSMTQDEYYQLRQEQAAGAYVHTVRAAYMSLLKDIAASCCRDILFASQQANRLTQAILDDFQVKPDFPWEGSAHYQSYGTFRHASNRKWFALIMNVKRDVLDKDGNTALTDIINVKIPPAKGDELRQISGIYPAYHMNHKTWISVVLDDTLSDESIMDFINTSYQLTIH